VTPLSSDICQLRLDFDAFNLAITSADGTCIDTFAATTSSGRTYPSLCGAAAGQHIYLETAQATTAQTLAFTVTATTGSATYKLKVSQIECSSKYKAPTDCYQYYTGESGRIKSFNRSAGRMLRNLQYSACIRREPGTCGIQWAPTSTTEYSPSQVFDLGDPAASAIIGSAASALPAYIVIPGSLSSAYSGGMLGDTTATVNNGAILASGQRYLLMVFSMDSTTATADGFDLTWHQHGCTHARGST